MMISCSYQKVIDNQIPIIMAVCIYTYTHVGLYSTVGIDLRFMIYCAMPCHIYTCICYGQRRVPYPYMDCGVPSPLPVALFVLTHADTVIPYCLSCLLWFRTLPGICTLPHSNQKFI